MLVRPFLWEIVTTQRRCAPTTICDRPEAVADQVWVRCGPVVPQQGDRLPPRSGPIRSQ